MPAIISSIRNCLLTCLLVVVAGYPAVAQQAADSVAPEFGNERQSATLAHAKNYMIAAANPLAAQAGQEMLAKGGSAADALIAAQWVLGLVEPQSSGLGGGAFLARWPIISRIRMVVSSLYNTSPWAAWRMSSL